MSNGELGSTEEIGNNGAFLIPYQFFTLRVIANDGMGWDPSLTVARYMILRLFISMRYRWYPMYLGCLFCLFVYVEFFRIFLQ